MGNLTKNLSRHEFECRCGCGFDTVDFMLIKLLQAGADYFNIEYGKIIIDIRGGNRCKEHNETVQKKYVKDYIPYSSKSTHMDAKGSDFKYWYYDGLEKKQIEPLLIYNYFDNLFKDSLGLGLYHNRVHLDSRDKKARWGK